MIFLYSFLFWGTSAISVIQCEAIKGGKRMVRLITIVDSNVCRCPRDGTSSLFLLFW